MTKRWILLLLVSAGFALAQQAKQQPDKKQPKKSATPKLKIYVAVDDYINGKKLTRFKPTQFIIYEALRIAQLAKKDGFIKQRVAIWKKGQKYPKLDDKALYRKAEVLWYKKRKFFGLTGLDYSHIKILKKSKKKPKKSEDELVPPEGGKKGKKEGGEGVDLREAADIVIEGRVDTLRKEPSKFLGEVVTYNAESVSDIKVVDRRRKKVVAHIVKRHKMGAAKHKGQGKAYQNAIKAVAEDVAKEILRLEPLRKGVRKFDERPPVEMKEQKGE
ncbi:MAG: hypothetical protein DRP63_05135 [Planctomycetota bacterium]|nr:MAG: hypothetical protein DRP63_05135 [Planctomycetota bacterium]